MNDINQNQDQIKFLIVDDENHIVEILDSYINNKYNYQSVKAFNGQEAFKICENIKFDFILTDYKMPLLNGSDFIRKIRKEVLLNKKTPIIMLTGFSPNWESDVEKWDNVFFLEKPTNFQQLDFIIKCCLKLAAAA